MSEAIYGSARAGHDGRGGAGPGVPGREGAPSPGRPKERARFHKATALQSARRAAVEEQTRQAREAYVNQLLTAKLQMHWMLQRVLINGERLTMAIIRELLDRSHEYVSNRWPSIFPEWRPAFQPTAEHYYDSLRAQMFSPGDVHQIMLELGLAEPIARDLAVTIDDEEHEVSGRRKPDTKASWYALRKMRPLGFYDMRADTAHEWDGWS